MPIHNFEPWDYALAEREGRTREPPVHGNTRIDTLYLNGNERLDLLSGGSYCMTWGESGGSSIIGWRRSRDRDLYLSIPDPSALNHITYTPYSVTEMPSETAWYGDHIFESVPPPLQEPPLESLKKDTPEESITWQEREFKRFEPTPVQDFNVVRDATGAVRAQYHDTGEFSEPMYKDLPESVQLLMHRYGFIPDDEHFLHRAQHNKSHVAYIEDEDKGKSDRQTSQKIGKYVKKFSPLMPDHHVAEIAALYRKEMLGSIDIKFARTREEIKDVYLRGPSSCMSHDLGSFHSGDTHPVEVYATPDIAIAYTERDGRVNARAVCNMISEEYTRIYGDEVVMYEGLEDLGFKEGGLQGCRLLKLMHDGKCITPYLDGGCTTLDILDDSLLISDDGSICADSQYGLLEANTMCGHCEDHHHEDNMHWSDYHDTWICEGCIDEYTYAYTNHGETYIRNSETSLYLYRGEYYTSEVLSDYDLVVDSDGDVINKGNAEYSEVDDEYYAEGKASWYKDSCGDLVCTVNFANDLVQPEDEEHHMLDCDCYEFNGLYYREEQNKMEAENEHTEHEENRQEVA